MLCRKRTREPGGSEGREGQDGSDVVEEEDGASTPLPRSQRRRLSGAGQEGGDGIGSEFEPSEGEGGAASEEEDGSLDGEAADDSGKSLHISTPPKFRHAFDISMLQKVVVLITRMMQLEGPAQRYKTGWHANDV